VNQLRRLNQWLYPEENDQQYIDLQISQPPLMLHLKLPVCGVFHNDLLNHKEFQ